MKKVLLFLDFDGVISHIRDSWNFNFKRSYSSLVTTFTEETHSISDFSHIGLCHLRSLLETPGLEFKLVWITSHRIQISKDNPLGLAKGTEILLRECIPNIDKMFLGCTPRLDTKRHLEVKEFLSKIDTSKYDHIILIDDDEEQYNYPNNVKVFTPDHLLGLSNKLLDDIRNYLK